MSEFVEEVLVTAISVTRIVSWPQPAACRLPPPRSGMLASFVYWTWANLSPPGQNSLGGAATSPPGYPHALHGTELQFTQHFHEKLFLGKEMKIIKKSFKFIHSLY